MEYEEIRLTDEERVSLANLIAQTSLSVANDDQRQFWIRVLRKIQGVDRQVIIRRAR